MYSPDFLYYFCLVFRISFPCRILTRGTFLHPLSSPLPFPLSPLPSPAQLTNPLLPLNSQHAPIPHISILQILLSLPLLFSSSFQSCRFWDVRIGKAVGPKSEGGRRERERSGMGALGALMDLGKRGNRGLGGNGGGVDGAMRAMYRDFGFTYSFPLSPFAPPSFPSLLPPQPPLAPNRGKEEIRKRKQPSKGRWLL